MKKIVIALLLSILCLSFSNAQTLIQLWGLTKEGGDSGGGVVFNYNTLTNRDSIVFSFHFPGVAPFGSLVQASDGNFYGMTNSGGSNGFGTIFRCSPSGSYSTLVDFNGVDADSALGNLIQATDGNLYGMSYTGGTYRMGTLFRCTTSGQLTILVNFNDTNGEYPYGSLIQANDGNLYGMTSYGGPSNSGGTIFKCSLTGQLTTIAGFSYFDSINVDPQGSLIQGTNGKLYGMTTQYGVGQSYGAIFECTLSGKLKKLATFDGVTTGSDPFGSLIQAEDGNLYGLTSGIGWSGSYGNLFKCDTLGNLITLAYFNKSNGATPYGDLVQAYDGNLYGMTSMYGKYGYGTVFEFNLTKDTLTTVEDFNDMTGANPRGNLILAKDSNLYGMTQFGGVRNSYGTIFKINTSGSFTRLYCFGSSPNGFLPSGSLMQANDGNLYGMTQAGGLFGNGTIFKCTTAGTLTTLVSFNDSNGSAPLYGGLTQASDGNLYGMTEYGGTQDLGNIFKCTTSGLITNIVSFNTTNGARPEGSLIQGADSSLYGMTLVGGPQAGEGTVFKCTTSGVFTTLVNFNGVNGGGPSGNVIQVNGDTLYGMTELNIFKCSTTGAFKTMVTFNDTNGANPKGSLIQAYDGNFYGMTWEGLNNGGTLFKMTPGGKLIEIAQLLDGNGNGIYPYGSLVQGSDGNFYGLTSAGGSNDFYNSNPFFDDGTIFKVSPSGVYSTLLTFNDTNGMMPYGNLIQMFNVTITASSKCIDSELIARVGGGISPYTYLWSTGATTSSINGINNPGYYSVVVTDSRNMKDTASIVLPALTPLSVVVGTGAEICLGKSVTLLAKGSGGTGSLSYNWLPGNLNGISPSVSPSVATIYTVTVKDSIGCKDSALEAVAVNSNSGFDLTGSLTVCIDTPTFSSASIQACIYNNRCFLTNGTLKLIVDTNIHIANIISDSVAHLIGDTLEWNYDSLVLNGAPHCVSLNGIVNKLPVGDSVFVSMSISPTIGDSIPENNSITYWVKAFPYNCIGLPFDPNNKSVSPKGNIASDQKLTYTIHFQNTGTAAAKNVVVIDTLSPYLDPTTLEIISSSNNYNAEMINGHIVKFIFDNINLTDTSVNKLSSTGVFSFSIMPAKNVGLGELIINSAGIYFDNNPGITTNLVANKIVSVVSAMENINSVNHILCFPNPFTSSTSIVFNTDGKHYIELDDITGRKVESMEYKGLQFELQRNGLASGIYFVKAYDEGYNYVATTKLIVW